MKLVVVVQARTDSTRLPGKILLPLAGKPALERQLERILAAEAHFDVVVATTRAAVDDRIARLSAELGVRVYRGHTTDLLERHYEAACAFGADAVAKIPSDCPLIDPAAIDRVVAAFHATAGQYDLVTNLSPPTWPDGNDIEIMSMEALRRAHAHATLPTEREHTTPFIYSHPGEFRILNVRWETGNDFSNSHRFTLDYPEDYALIERIYREFWRPDQPVFGLRAILELLADNTNLARLNQRYCGETWRTRAALAEAALATPWSHQENDIHDN